MAEQFSREGFIQRCAVAWVASGHRAVDLSPETLDDFSLLFDDCRAAFERAAAKLNHQPPRPRPPPLSMPSIGVAVKP